MTGTKTKMPHESDRKSAGTSGLLPAAAGADEEAVAEDSATAGASSSSSSEPFTSAMRTPSISRRKQQAASTGEQKADNFSDAIQRLTLKSPVKTSARCFLGTWRKHCHILA